MPSYKFFELKNEGKKSPTKFREFKIETSKRGKRTHSAHSDHQEGFKAQPMPDFSKVQVQNLPAGTRHTIAHPFSLTTQVRGTDKQKPGEDDEENY